MQFSLSLGLVAAMAASQVAATSMKYYAPGAGVEAGFKTFLNNLYNQAEAPAATTAFTDIFTSTGKLIVLSNSATGAAAILKLKQTLMPVAGTKHWNHFPDTTTVYATTTTTKTYQVFGKIQTTYDGGSCSSANYKSRFTVTLGAGGVPGFGKGSLVTYDDYVVDPSVSPTTIPCTN